MAKVHIGAGPTNLSDGILQLENGVAMDATLRAVADQNNTTSPLELSTGLVSVTSTLQIATNDTQYIDAEDTGGNNRFTVSRSSGSQVVNVDFASNPTLGTEQVGAIRTYTDGVSLSDSISFLKNGNVGIGINAPTARTHIKGSGSTSATTSLLVQNSSGTAAFQITDDRTTTISGTQTNLSTTKVFVGALSLTSAGAPVSGTAIYSTGIDGKIVIATSRQGALISNYAGVTISLLTSDNPKSVLQIASGFNDGNADNLTGNTLYLTPTYNFTNAVRTGTIVRGIYYNPTLTSLVNTTHYGIQTTSGGAYINTVTPNASAALQADSNTQGFLPPRMTTAEKLAIATPAAGLQVYDSTLNQMSYYNGATWINF